MSGTAIINGAAMALADARLAISDDGVARGDGAFESIGVWARRPFRLEDHLERLGRSLSAIGLAQPDFALIRDEVDALLDGMSGAQGALRIFVTGSGSRMLTLGTLPPIRESNRLSPQPAPWIRPLESYRPAGAKTMSYSPNMTATRAAQAEGADDALLISLEGLILEGPTFCVLWVADGVLHAPELELGIVDSISRRTLLELADEAAIPVARGRWGLADLAGASELMLCSALRELSSVGSVDALEFDGAAPVRGLLADRLRARRLEG
ncbi:MAG TPA: aminotransferase class IV [Egibacteraceae bacterium]|nr:aminotransferase class IV [Egibacteraceae bacterium]